MSKDVLEGNKVCKTCEGNGWVVDVESEIDCCQNPTEYGSCCGNGILRGRQVQVLCPECKGYNLTTL